MAANLNGNIQSIQPFEVDIYQGLKPDVVCVQEFNYSNNAAADFRSLIDTAFGTNYSYYRESASGLQIPNGIISRYPIIESGRWVDTQVSNRGFAWARIDLPGTNDLYAVSVHLLTTSSSNRATEAGNLKALILANFPANAWIVIAGDFNTTSRSETAITTFAGFCPDSPIPTDAESGGNYNSNANRNKPYDYVLASQSFTNYLTNVVFASHSFSKGLVFDSRIYTPLTDVSPIVYGDSGQGQHMAVLKDFSIPVTGGSGLIAPIINTQPQSRIVSVGASATFSVSANGTAPLSYQWRFSGTNILGATTNSYTITNAQTTNSGSYVVVITNSAGSITSSVAMLTVSNTAPIITTPPADTSVYQGDTAVFSVVADGTEPLGYQWRFNNTNIAAATGTDYSFNNAQFTNAGNYTVVVSNLVGSITSVVAVLTVSSPVPVILTPPAPLTVFQGEPASFNVDAGGSSPLDFQWRFNGTNLPNATDNPLTIAAAQLSDAGNYSVVVTNFAGSVTSAVVTLTVNLVVAGTATNVVISQIFGGGGNTGAPYQNDYVELFNPTVNPVNLGSWSIQYSSATGSSWSLQKANLTGTIQAYSYYLIKLAGGSSGVAVPTADATNTFNISATAGKIALVSSQTALAGTNPVGDPTVVDFVGYGGTANGYEGSGPAVGGSSASTNAIFRKNGGYTDSNDNTNDFTTSTPNPRNSASPANPPASSPAAAPVLGSLAFSGGQLQFNLTGTAGSNYIVLSATNLAAPVWIPLRTNPAPFTFTESNLAPPQKFYRAKVQ